MQSFEDRYNSYIRKYFVDYNGKRYPYILIDDSDIGAALEVPETRVYKEGDTFYLCNFFTIDYNGLQGGVAFPLNSLYTLQFHKKVKVYTMQEYFYINFRSRTGKATKLYVNKNYLYNKYNPSCE